jgi:rfaE bifunctional protein kinase chain/domain
MTVSKDTFKQLATKRLLVVGDVMLDEYHWCTVHRISPEAPVPVCKVQKTTLAPGGAANVANNIAALSVQVDLCGLIGNDSTGEKLKQCLKTQKINTDGLLFSSRATTLKSRIIAGQQHVVRLDREDDNDIKRSERFALYNYIESRIKNYDALLLSDYSKGVLNGSFCKKIIDLARKHQCPVVVDPKGSDYKKYKGATVITPNFKEFCDLTKRTYKSELDIEKHAQLLCTRLNLQSLVITRSEKGMSIVDSVSKRDINTKAKEVFDITGAGDTVLAVLTACISLGLPVYESANIANNAAGIVVSKLGTATVSLEELLGTLE